MGLISRVSSRTYRFIKMALEVNSGNHENLLKSAGKVKEIKADFEGLDKKAVRAALKSCKEKLEEEGTILVKGIKNKNALILAGFTQVAGDSSTGFTGQVKTFQAVSLNLGNSEASTPINPESLLKPEDKIKPNTTIYDCGVDLGKKRQACKDCSCGLAAELEDEAKAKIIENINKGMSKSNCNSCSLGDAFRCGTCPYAGMPAFDKANPPKLITTTDFQQSDI